MRVTWIALEWPREGHHSGGVGRYTMRMAEQTAKLIDLHVIAFEGALTVPGVRFTLLPAPRGRLDRYYLSAWRVRAAVAATKPDVVHAHGDDFLVSGRAPIVRTFHGSSLSEAWASRGLRRINHFVLGGLEWWAGRRAHTRLGIAPETVEMFDCEDLFPPFLGIQEASTRSPSTVPSVAFIGSFQGRKQGWLAQQALAHIRATVHPEARLMVIGPSTDASAWEPWVEHHSGLTDTEVSDLLATAWLLVSPSSYEGFGIPVVEGLANDVRVVALHNPGSDYIRGQGAAMAPLHLTTEEGFIDRVSASLSSGPWLSEIETVDARSLVAALTYAGSPLRLQHIYQRAISAQ